MDDLARARRARTERQHGPACEGCGGPAVTVDVEGVHLCLSCAADSVEMGTFEELFDNLLYLVDRGEMDLVRQLLKDYAKAGHEIPLPDAFNDEGSNDA